MSSVLLEMIFPRQSFVDSDKKPACGPAARDPAQFASGVPLQLLLAGSWSPTVSVFRWFWMYPSLGSWLSWERSSSVTPVRFLARCLLWDPQAGAASQAASLIGTAVLTLARAVMSVNTRQGTWLGDLFTSPGHLSSHLGQPGVCAVTPTSLSLPLNNPPVAGHFRIGHWRWSNGLW